MEVIKYKDFLEDGEEAADILRTAGDSLNPKDKQKFELAAARGNVLRQIKQATGNENDVFSSSDPANDNVAGFYDEKKHQTHLRNKTLDDPSWAEHASEHENLHPKVLSNVEITKYLSTDHAAPIVTALQKAEELQGVKRLGDVDWVEGFTELINIMENEEHPRCAYNKLEVPAARELEKLCMEHTGQSLIEAFKTKNAGLFYHRLRKLADCMLLKETADEMEKKSSNTIDIRELVTERLKHGHISVQDKKDAKKIIGKILEEEAKIESIKLKLAA